MKTQWTLLLLGGLSAIAPRTARAQALNFQPMVVTNLTGDLRIQLSLPLTCDDIDQTTPVAQGRLEITPSEGIDVPGGKRFTLTRANLSFAPFTIHRSCIGENVTRNYTEVGVQLGQTVSFTASPAAPGAFDILIPKDDFLIYESARVNDGLETGYRRAKEDVTGSLDFTNRTAQMRVAVPFDINIKALCTPFGCVIDETRHGTLTADLAGTIVFPDSDGDGVPDRSDNCPLVSNPGQGPVASPVVNAPGDVTLASCADNRIGRAVAADICEARPVTVTNNAPSPFPLGATLVTWSAQDTHGRVGTDDQTVTVVDTTPPVITSVPPDLHLNDCVSPDLGLPTATDDCGGTPTFTNDAPSPFLVGTTVVTWTASDLSGNHATATQTVTVIDTVAPTVSCTPDGPPGGTFQVLSTDHCAVPIIRLGSFVLTSGERIKINEVGQSGIRLIGVVGPDHIRHFHVGKGEALITSTDPSNNVASAYCR